MNGKLTVATTGEQEQALLTINDKSMTGKMMSYLIVKEGLQGEYRGTVFLLPISLPERALGYPLTVGRWLGGNFTRDSKLSAMHSKRRGNW